VFTITRTRIPGLVHVWMRMHPRSHRPERLRGMRIVTRDCSDASDEATLSGCIYNRAVSLSLVRSHIYNKQKWSIVAVNTAALSDLHRTFDKVAVNAAYYAGMTFWAKLRFFQSTCFLSLVIFAAYFVNMNLNSRIWAVRRYSLWLNGTTNRWYVIKCSDNIVSFEFG